MASFLILVFRRGAHSEGGAYMLVNTVLQVESKRRLRYKIQDVPITTVLPRGWQNRTLTCAWCQLRTYDCNTITELTGDKRIRWSCCGRCHRTTLRYLDPAHGKYKNSSLMRAVPLYLLHRSVASL